MTMKVSEFFFNLGSTLKSCVKIVLLSRRPAPVVRCTKPGDDIVVLGNGPSLKDTISHHLPVLEADATVAVNFMANAPEFAVLRPDYYVLADPHFFNGLAHENVENLWRNISRADWPMTLCVPVAMCKTARRLIGRAPNITVSGFNFVGIEGFGWFERWAYSRRLGMPRPRNVLIPAIMTAIAAGYKEIYVVGADHSWLETIRVTENNHVVSVQPHFYADSQKELKRSETEYRGFHLHDILQSFYIAFRSYHTLMRYAVSKGIHIYNSTPGSYIDAFPRRALGSRD